MDTSPYIQLIKDAGYRVFVRPHGRGYSYCFFTDGKRIGYAQWSNNRTQLSSVHRPNRTTGTGFEVADSINPQTLAVTLDCVAPHWASGRDRDSVQKYKSMDAYLRESAWNSELVEV